MVTASFNRESLSQCLHQEKTTNALQIHWRAHADQQDHVQRRGQDHQRKGKRSRHQITTRAPTAEDTHFTSQSMSCRPSTTTTPHHRGHASWPSTLRSHYDYLLSHPLRQSSAVYTTDLDRLYKRCIAASDRLHGV